MIKAHIKKFIDLACELGAMIAMSRDDLVNMEYD